MQDHSLACLGTSPPEWFFIQNGSLRMQPHATQLQLRDRSRELAHFPTTLGLARGLLVTNRESLQVFLLSARLGFLIEGMFLPHLGHG